LIGAKVVKARGGRGLLNVDLLNNVSTTVTVTPADLAASVGEELGRLKWLLWDGNVFRAVQVTGDLIMDLDVDVADADISQRKLLKVVNDFETYIRANAWSIPNYGERYRDGEPISSSFVESAVNQAVSKRRVNKQQMRWRPRGAHLLLQVRTRVLNDDLAYRHPPVVPELRSHLRTADAGSVASHGLSHSPTPPWTATRARALGVGLRPVTDL
jgi:hypothetical protein